MDEFKDDRRAAVHDGYKLKSQPFHVIEAVYYRKVKTPIVGEYPNGIG